MAVTRVSPIAQPVLLSNFQDREDLIRALLTSCHVPWWFDGNAFTGRRRVGRGGWVGGQVDAAHRMLVWQGEVEVHRRRLHPLVHLLACLPACLPACLQSSVGSGTAMVSAGAGVGDL